MWSGFLVDVPREALVQALDVVVPIQVALGTLFCAPEAHDCRPSALLAIDLTDAQASEARVRVQLERGSTRELPLTLHLSAAGWRADPGSLSSYLEQCRRPEEAKLR
jgi:hypothetical protein